MLAKVVDSTVFHIVLLVCGAGLAVAALFLLYFFLCVLYARKQIFRLRRKKDRTLRKMYEEANKKRKKHMYLAAAACILCAGVILYGLWVKQEYSPKGDVRAALLSGISDVEFFKEQERTLPKMLNQCEKALHMDWYMEQKLSDGGVTRNAVDGYELQVRILFQNNQNRKDTVSTSIPEAIQESYEVYRQAVFQGNRNRIEQLIQGYRSGEEIIPYYSTSETVFQAMVLAESANIAQFGELSEPVSNELDSLRAFTVLMERFLSFETLNAGDGIIIERQQASFRMGKMLYRQVLYQSSLPEDMRLHCILFAYGCFAYSEEEEAMDSESYLLYLYYRSLSCLELLKDVKDAELGRALCQEELLLWGALEAAYPREQWTRYFLDGESMDNVLFAQTQLRAMERQFSGMCSE